MKIWLIANYLWIVTLASSFYYMVTEYQETEQFETYRQFMKYWTFEMEEFIIPESDDEDEANKKP